MFCPDCGYKNRLNARFCTSCGYSLVQGPPPAVKPVPPVVVSSPVNPPVLDKTKSVPPVNPPVMVSPLVQDPLVLVPTGSLTVGTVLDNRYEIISHIATGGMGAVYKARFTRLNTIVAVKEMLDFFQSEDERNYAIKRFQEEALLLSKIRHPNIPRVTDNFIERNRYYLIMDFVEGKSAEKLQKEAGGQGLGIERVVLWAIQISDVLYYLHTQSPPIIYRDMKPSNIMICEKDHVMVVDFGIARHFTPRRPGTMIGTHGYAPPEQYKGNTEPKSDLYALCATLHHLITGNDPTQGVPFNFKPMRTYRKEVPVKLDEVILRSLHNLPEKRHNTAMELKKDLEEVYEELIKGGTAGSYGVSSQYYGSVPASVRTTPPPSQVSVPASVRTSPPPSQVSVPASVRTTPPPSQVSVPASVRTSPPPSQVSTPPPIRAVNQAHPPPSPPLYSASPSRGNKGEAWADPQKNIESAKSYIEKSNFKKAKSELEKVLAVHPDHTEALTLLGYVLMRLGKLQDSVKNLNKAVALQPASATGHFYLGKAYARMGNSMKAQEEYRIAGRLDPTLFKGKKEGFLEKLIRSILD